MSVIVKRFQQAAFEMAASSNRTAGSGGGSGFRVAGDVVTSAGWVAGITNGGWSTIATITFNLGHPTDVLVWANLAFNRTAGTIADTFFAELQKDSDADWNTGFGILDGGTINAGAPNDAVTRALFLMKAYAGLATGQHTLNLKATVNGDTFQGWGSITYLAFGR